VHVSYLSSAYFFSARSLSFSADGLRRSFWKKGSREPFVVTGFAKGTAMGAIASPSITPEMRSSMTGAAATEAELLLSSASFSRASDAADETEDVEAEGDDEAERL